MSDSFVPLAAKAAHCDASEPFRVKILPSNGAPATFQPLANAVCSAKPAAHPKHDDKPQVTLVREGERIVAIRVRCECGEVMELECVY